MQVEILKSTVSDNYFYLLHDGEAAALIDPIDSATAIAAVERSGARLDAIINTHWHPDHVGGNDAVLARFPDAEVISGPDHGQISTEHGVDRIVAGGDDVTIGSFTLGVIETPGHTAGHISLRHEDDLFAGDTIFVGGAGNCRFGGDPSVLFQTYRDVLSALPANVRFYPGHDYARRNVEFALSLEPELTAAKQMLARLQERASLVVTTLGEEQRYNPFFRFGAPDLQSALRERHAQLWIRERESSQSDDEATFRATRDLRNSW